MGKSTKCLVKKGQPLPGKPSFKYSGEAILGKSREKINKTDNKIFNSHPNADLIRHVHVPEQTLFYEKKLPKRRKVRITPKRPRISG